MGETVLNYWKRKCYSENSFTLNSTKHGKNRKIASTLTFLRPLRINPEFTVHIPQWKNLRQKNSFSFLDKSGGWNSRRFYHASLLHKISPNANSEHLRTTVFSIQIYTTLALPVNFQIMQQSVFFLSFSKTWIPTQLDITVFLKQ